MKQTKGPNTDDLHFCPLEVKVPVEDQTRDRIEFHIKRFRAKVTKDRIMSDWKEHQSYEKPSDKKRRQRRESVQRKHKMEMIASRESKFDKEDKKKNDKRRSRSSGVDER